jgi:hypothetical protein
MLSLPIKRMGTRLRFVYALAIAIFAVPAGAKIDLVTLPARDKSQITIYNQEDLTLVREQRTLNLRAGENLIQFSWAGTLIDPTSLELAFPGSVPGDCEIEDVSYPSGTENLLVWHIKAKKAGSAPIEILYFTSGLSWAADYVLVADPDEKKLRMEAWVKVTNQSGEDYENAETRLLVGEVNLVEKIAELARRGVAGKKDEVANLAVQEMMKAAPMVAYDMAAGGVAEQESRPKEIVKEGVSEYFLYSIEGRETIENTWAKRLPSFQLLDVPFDVSYEYDDQKYGDRVVLFYKYKNDKEHLLGKEPLPDGQYGVFREAKEGGLGFINTTQLKYVPIGEDIELNLGSDGLVVIEPKMMDFRRENVEFQHQGINRVGEVIGYDEIAKWKIEIRNSRGREIPLKVVRHFGGDWEIETKEAFKRKDKNTLEFERSVPALSTMTIEYTTTTRTGSRARR